MSDKVIIARLRGGEHLEKVEDLLQPQLRLIHHLGGEQFPAQADQGESKQRFEGES